MLEIVERLSEMMAERMAVTGKTKEDVESKSNDGQCESLANRLAGRIKELFSL